MPVSPEDLPDNLYTQKEIAEPTLRNPVIWIFFAALCLAGGLAFCTYAFPLITGVSNLPSLGGGTVPSDKMRLAFRVLAFMCTGTGALGMPLAIWYSYQPDTMRLRPLISVCLILTSVGPVFYVYSQVPAAFLPYDFALWAMVFHDAAEVQPYLLETGAAGGALALLSFIGFYLGLTGRTYEISTAYGSAEFGDGTWFAEGPPQSKFGQMVSSAKDYGFPIGWQGDKMLYDRTGQHVFVQAPTGSGKTRGFVIPTLLMHIGSVLTIDIKRELSHVTAKRRHDINGDVHRLDPFSRKVESAKYNPLQFVDPYGVRSDTAKDDADMLASMMVIETGNENNPFFIRSAQQLVAGLTLFVSCIHPEDSRLGDANRGRHLGHMRDLLMMDNDDLQSLCDALGDVDDADISQTDESRVAFVFGQALDNIGDRAEEVSPEVARQIAQFGNQFAKMNDKEFTAVVSTAREQTKFLSSSRIREVVSETTFNFSQMKTRERGSSIFLCLPEERLETYFRWLRLMIFSAQTEITRLDHTQTNDLKAMFLLEEFPRLSKMKQIDKGVSLHRSYDIQYVLICQSRNQIKQVYGEEMASNIRENCHLKLAWSPDSPDSAQLISDLCGKTTVATETESKNKSRQSGEGGSSKTVSESIQEMDRSLVTPEEARRTPQEYAFVFTRGCPPFVCRRPDYVTDPMFEELYDPHPEHSPREEFEKARRRRIRKDIITPAETSEAAGGSGSTNSSSSSSSVGHAQPTDSEEVDRSSPAPDRSERGAASQGAASEGNTSEDRNNLDTEPDERSLMRDGAPSTDDTGGASREERDTDQEERSRMGRR